MSETFESMMTSRLSGKWRITSGINFLPVSLCLVTLPWASRRVVCSSNCKPSWSPILSSRVRRRSSPKLPCVLFSPVRAAAKRSARSPISSVFDNVFWILSSSLSIFSSWSSLLFATYCFISSSPSRNGAMTEESWFLFSSVSCWLRSLSKRSVCPVSSWRTVSSCCWKSSFCCAALICALLRISSICC